MAHARLKTLATSALLPLSALVLLSARLAAQEVPLEPPAHDQDQEQEQPSAELPDEETGQGQGPARNSDGAAEDQPSAAVAPEPGLDDICKIDPEACPTIDFKKEAAKPLTQLPHVHVSSLREKTDPRIVLRAGEVEAGGEVAYVTGQSPLVDERLAFTDLAFVRLAARRSFIDSLELDLGATFAIKQPTGASEPFYQGATLGARLEFREGLAAELSGSHAPLIRNDGNAWSLEEGFAFKHEVYRYLRFRLGAGGSVTTLAYERPTARPFWLQEAFGRGEAQFGDTNAAFWVGADYHVPIASSPNGEQPDPVYGSLDPRIGIGLEIGGVVSTRDEGWDVYAIYRVVDRGDAERPETELPILDGGFDQTQFIFGVRHQFGPPPELR